MSYSSRVYRQRNPKPQEETKEKPFFSKQEQSHDSKRNSSFFQSKLAVNELGDSHEKEADSVANAVVNQKQSKPVVQQKEISPIQRLATTSEEEKVSSNDERMERDKEKPFQKKPAEPEKEKEETVQKKDDPLKEKDIHRKEDPLKEKDKTVQKKEADLKEKEEDKSPAAVQKKQVASSSNAVSPQLSNSVENSSGKGSSLPKKTLYEMNHSFGRDFSGVRIHHDGESASMNKELEAHAFTHGYDIYFNQGKFNPENAEGKFLLAHELTHVLQQNQTTISRDPAPAKPRFNFPVSFGFFKDFDATYLPDNLAAGEGIMKITHNIFLVFGDKLDSSKREKFRKDFRENVSLIWQDKFLFELNDPDFTSYKAHLKLDISFVDNPKDAHTIMEVKNRSKDFRSNVEGQTSDSFPALSHTAHLDTGDPSPEELAKKNAGKTFLEPSIVEQVGNFDFDSSVINTNCEKGIDHVEKALDALPDTSTFNDIATGNEIHYIGRASPEGNKWYNQQLSKRRAEAVKQKVEKDKPVAKGMAVTLTGEGADKSGFENEKENYRRVNVLIFPFTEFSKQHKKDQNIASHEFGHMMGLGDEYSEKGTSKFEKKVEGDRPSHYDEVKAIMGQEAADELSMNQSASIMSMGNEIKKGHYAFFLKALRDMTGKQGWKIE